MAQHSSRRRVSALITSAALTTGVVASLGVAATPATAAQDRSWERRLQEIVDAGSAARLSEAMSTYPGLIGTDGDARRVAYSVDKLTEWGLDPRVEPYDVYSSVPQDIAVTMTAPTRRELEVKESPYPWQQNFEHVVVGYNAYSPAGDVSADVVYVNYGLPEDYARLDELGVDAEGKIVLARYGRSFRGVKAQVAEEHGAAGVILYSDPEDDGFVRGPVYPEGPWRNAEGIQRGSIQYIFEYPGDPLTRGAPSVPGTPRIDPSEAENLPRVPTTPISYGQARHLLAALDGPAAPQQWQGGLDLDYHIGPGPTAVDLDLDIDYEQLPVDDVIVEIPGAEHPEQKVVVGAHVDTWTYGTADNVSGWTTVMETARAMSQLLEQGWRPDRTIVLAGWGGEEYGLLGSTEWVEEHRADLVENAVAYLNLDGTGGQNFGAGAVPALDDVLVDIARQVRDPDHGTVYANWQQASDQQHPTAGRLGSGSDYTAFLDHLGVASADVGMSTPSGEYHSAYDDLYQMRNFLDPGYTHHAVASSYVGTFALRLADADTLPLVYSDYAHEVGGYLRTLDRQQAGDPVVDLGPAYAAVRDWRRAAKHLEIVAYAATRRGDESRYPDINDALLAQERALTQEEGLPGREWFKHMVYAPGFYTGYAVQPLSAIDDAISDGDTANATRYRDLLVDSLQHATQEARDGARRG